MTRKLHWLAAYCQYMRHVGRLNETYWSLSFRVLDDLDKLVQVGRAIERPGMRGEHDAKRDTDAE